MNAEVDQVQRAHQRISALQRSVADQERANQHKSKELMEREQRLEEQEVLLVKRESIFQAQREQRRLAKRNRASLIAPVLLITCCIAGYLAYEQISQQRQYFEQVKTAQKHVDKLTRVLSLTQARMVNSHSDIALVESELKAAQEQIALLESELQNQGTSPKAASTIWSFALGSQPNDYGAKRERSQTLEASVDELVEASKAR